MRVPAVAGILYEVHVKRLWWLNWVRVGERQGRVLRWRTRAAAEADAATRRRLFWFCKAEVVATLDCLS